MKILLIRPRPPKETIGLQHVMICEPLELEYLAGNIDPSLAEVRILDMILERGSIDRFVREYQPDIVGLTGYITHIGVVKEYASRVKKILPSAVTVVGGVHAEVVPEDFVDKNIDYIICADPIGTFVRIVEAVNNNRSSSSDKEKNNNCKGYAHENAMENALDNVAKHPHIEGTYSPNAEIIKPTTFNYLPPDRSKVAKYRSRYYYMFHNPCALVKTSFGCPFDCSFCFCKEVTDGKYFARPIEEVVEELKTISEQEIYLVDDDFLFGVERLNRFCDLLEKEKLDKRFLVYGRADFIANNEKLIARLAQNGLRAVIVGIESIREKDLENFNKKTTIETNRRAIEILNKYDIELYATMILSLDYSKSDFRQLEQYIKQMGIFFVNLQPLTPLPGTDIFDQYENKILVDRSDYAKWDLAHIVLKPKHLSIRAYYFQMIRLYYKVVMRPSNVRRMIRKYGLLEVLKLSWGSSFVSWQYFKKMITGK